ncbi:hypothetical protein B5864_13845 [Salmonella enterica]|uniref:Uncharacterized protein n=2 Tax=Salmonella enterica TaxID=28901 RepID=A0A403T272_SALER|nr:hypothetical protein [Salmonella sp. SG203]EAB7739572.1 hypothetical protein [Salmonella enterica subsp. enterica serovar Hadar]EAV6574943.1 hypothetical protein [Salmonella enterica]EBQ9003899.1 hypothetical protein [Salmonella enterica subsp. enterica serovar Blockley]EBR8258966.1 hypothetical protein [Salmonella enterica subsp. enterica serovar Cerro]EBW7251982.1 hypothetical protein [Salmonella enterica subsp. enterica serovar Gatow]EBX7469047.1 hypothetical protein [Salmonella enteric
MSKAEHKKRIRKLMIHAINEAIRAGVLPLMFRYRRMTAEGYANITVCGKPTVINWCDTGHDEFRVSVWWDYRSDLLPEKNRYEPVDLSLLLPDVNRDRFRFIVGACASFYFDYKHKGILSDRGKEFFAVYVRESTAIYIDELEDVEPFSYSISELSRPLQRIITSPAGGKHGKYFK